MLQKPVDKINHWQCFCFPLIGAAVFKAEGHLIVFDAFDAVVGALMFFKIEKALSDK